jgi:hypothetical protein
MPPQTKQSREMQATEIEVEVVEIDGKPADTMTPATHRDLHEPPGTNGRNPAGADWQDWRQWQGRVRTLDSRWWPLWVLLGIIVLALLLTVGLVVAVVVLLIRLCVGAIRAILR